ncbi:ArpU family transcriptional regulator [Paenibacillus filicis]|uniref:ArpU family transcriptional regulator n=1 Tax=Paenibacillus gyeongsangnamensis TaxID=3388067 RepID=A0ABT4Q9B0_9BACL|nr:ArpU family phage packaging/lysis transcriptional regulator [Paenibacillus filicis]MCZ8513465.1 ArpU family transcriptional regulator [Paenibacillus filicis]
MEQIIFPSEINKAETRRAVEERLESARIYKQIGFIRRETRTTAFYEAREHGTTNMLSNPTENIALWNVKKEERLREEQEQVEMAISMLGEVERQIIEKRYMVDDEVFDYNVIMEMHLSERKYYRLKLRAILKLAFALRLEVYLDQHKPLGKSLFKQMAEK